MDTRIAPIAFFVLLASSAFGQGPTPCPNEGETEVAPAGRNKDKDDCAVSSWGFWGKVGVSGTIVVVDAGAEGAIQYTHSSAANCPYQASSFSDQLSKCQGQSVSNSWCESQAYKVVEKRWETKDIDPCPDSSEIAAILDFILTGKWPGCKKLLPVSPVSHWSAQQRPCGLVDPEQTQYGANGQFILVDGDPRDSLPSVHADQLGSGPGVPPGMFGPDDPLAHSEVIQGLAQLFTPIPGELGMSIQSDLSTYSETGTVSYSRGRTISGSFRADRTYRFLCSQVAIDEATKERVPFLEEWARDQLGIYTWIHGGDRGISTTANGGLARAEEELEFPEVSKALSWMEQPFPLSYSSSMDYTIDESASDTTRITGRIKAEAPLDGASMILTLSKPDGLPILYEYKGANGISSMVVSYSDYLLIDGQYLRPMAIETMEFSRETGAITALWKTSISVRSFAPEFSEPIQIPQPTSGEWYVAAEAN